MPNALIPYNYPGRDWQGKPVTLTAMDVGHEGIAFMQDQLNQGCPLSSAVANEFANGGKAFAPLPVGTPSAKAGQFAYGGLLSIGSPHVLMADFFTSLAQGRGCPLVFEDPWMEQKDFENAPPATPHFFCGGRIYFMPDTDDLIAALAAGKREVVSFLQLGFAVSPPFARPESGQEVNSAFIQALARTTVAAFATAYDGEGYVVWERAAHR